MEPPRFSCKHCQPTSQCRLPQGLRAMQNVFPIGTEAAAPFKALLINEVLVLGVVQAHELICEHT